jgi:hypothetical protein
VKTLRIGILSLMLGILALVFGIYFISSPLSVSQQVPPLTWQEGGGNPKTGVRAGGGLSMEVTQEGRGMVILPVPRSRAVDYRFLHLELPRAPVGNSLHVLWARSQGHAQVFVYDIPGTVGTSIWLDTAEMPGWTGDIGELGVMALGRPGSKIALTKIELLPAALVYQLKTIYSNWTTFSAWRPSSVNAYLGVRGSASSLFPVPVIAALMILSLLFYAVLLFLFRASLRFNWHVVAIIILICWLSLDLLWQGRLLRQVVETRAEFSNKTTQEQLAVGPDAELVEFITEVKQRLVSADARIFVSSASDYLGMRGAYYLYPNNVYWKRKKKGLPRREYLHSGDYIVLVEPTAIRFDPSTAMLKTPKNKFVRVERILSLGAGSLFEVK